ncbi:hypothetical protein [Plantactinospora sp. KBS50]|uniref:hypothetical protein n=1 Tax=Plantactinospora sp. KBS50 TaxID=2024580 RepID=UPI000BAAA8AA|nr:hypothetical protein [Plantactinospora sp. KBS50]ASW56174.1 hypothetical protein CIK06_21435 [Plantactinospora sp. KBS50]
MFGSNLLDRRSRTERIADQAWDHLVAAVNSAGETIRDTALDTARSARSATAGLTDDARDRAGSVADEAWQRASLAFDALSGRRSRLPWTYLIAAGLIGAAVGWAAGTAARAAMARDNATLGAGDEVEFVDVDRPGSPASNN